MLEVDRINVFYGDLQTLWDVSLKLKEGDLVSVIGSNGAGKTTLLKTISGVLRPKSGSIKFQDKRVEGLPPHELVKVGITYIPEGGHIFPTMSTLENLEMGAYCKRAREKMDETLEWVYQLFPILKERKKQVAGTLSGGERQMLAIGRGLMSVPRLLLLDEPTLGLAPRLVLKTFEVVEKLHEEGQTILLTEQNVQHTMEISDIVYILETGRVAMDGRGKELLENPQVKRLYLGYKG